jgi:hypothetical protein
LPLRSPVLSVAALLACLLPIAPASVAVPADGITTPAPTRVERFNPDQQVCSAEAIRKGFATQMQPWVDQPEAVVARLREVQLDMTRATLRRCVSKGLMDRTQAEQLFGQLIAPLATSSTPEAAPVVSPPSTQTPASAPTTAPASGR